MRPLQERRHLTHINRDTKTALELAIVALAPSELIDRLARASGLLDAIKELPPDAAPAVALLPRVEAEARRALADWHEWEEKHLPKLKA